MEIRTLISAADIAAKITQLADAINRDYAGRELFLVGLLNGSVFFLTDLSRKLNMPVRIGFMDVSSYFGGTESAGFRIDMDLNIPVKGRDVLIVEDIVDTGKTLSQVVHHLKAKQPLSLHVCALLDKPERREISDFSVDYTGFVIPNTFVVGYGLDYEHLYRNIPYIGEMIL